jgi:pyruvate dehydrogenase E1 component beta subunit
LKAAIRSDDPVIFLEHAGLYNTREEVPEGDHVVPLGSALVRRPGRDVTILTYLHGLVLAQAAAENLAADGVECEVIDLRTLQPLDMETILASVRRTHRCVVVAEDTRTGSFASEVAARVYEEAFDDLDAPIERVTGEDVPMPYARNLEKLAVPDEAAIVAAVSRLMWREIPRGGEERVDGRVDDAENGRRHGGGHDLAVAQEHRGSR